jgi:hypothetical protein
LRNVSTSGLQAEGEGLMPRLLVNPALFIPLFTRVRGIGILGSSLARSCIDSPSRAARMVPEAHHAA